METLSPRFLRSTPRDAAVIPLPNEETTPPVTKTYFDISSILHDKEIYGRQH